MISLNVQGTLGKFGYKNIPAAISEDILLIAIEQAFMTAKKNAPYDTDDEAEPPIHIRDEIQRSFDNTNRIGYVWVKLPYANIAEYGSKHRLPHPFIRPAAKAAQNKMRAVVRTAVKKSVEAEQSRSGT